MRSRGVVDFLTAAPDHTSLLLRAAAGSFGANEESLLAGATRGRWSGRLTASRNFSTGFMADRDYRNEDASAENWLGSRLGITDLMLASSDRSFGANQFYGPYNSWERTKGWFASARQELGSRTVAAFGYRRHTDEFILLRDNPSVYENNHIDGSWQASLRHTIPIASPSLLLIGLRPTATASTATILAFTPAIAAQATSTSTCAPQSAAGISPHRRHRARDQEPAKFRQRFLRRLSRTHR